MRAAVPDNLCHHRDRVKLAHIAEMLDQAENRDAAGKPIAPGLPIAVTLIKQQRWYNAIVAINELHLKMFAGKPTDNAAFVAMQLGLIVSKCQGILVPSGERWRYPGANPALPLDWSVEFNRPGRPQAW